MTDPIRYTQAEGIGELQLTRPDKLNAMSHEMGDAIRALVQRLNADPDVRCVLVSGEGRGFSAGGDLDFLEANTRQTPEANREEMLGFYTKFLALRELAVPTIALLHGRATGAGLCFALGCDIRLAAQDALLSVNFVRLGLTPGMAGTWSLPRLVGGARAAELLYTGRALSGREAAEMGLVNAAYPAAELAERGRAMAREIATAGPVAVRETKALLRGSLERPLADALELEAAAQARCFAGAELVEGLAAIRGRRAPAY